MEIPDPASPRLKREARQQIVSAIPSGYLGSYGFSQPATIIFRAAADYIRNLRTQIVDLEREIDDMGTRIASLNLNLAILEGTGGPPTMAQARPREHRRGGP